jgi:cytochrome c biogenesis protein CcdA
LIVGTAVAFGAAALFAGVTFTSATGRTIRTLVGAALILLGLVQLGAIPLSFHWLDRFVRPLAHASAVKRRERPVLGYAVFGFGYVLAGFG